MKKHHGIPLGLRIIGISKLVIASLLAAASFGVFKLLNEDVDILMQQIIMLLHVDPKNHYLNLLLEKISGIDHKHMKAIGAATMIYSLLYLIEGVGLLRGKHWAEYMVIIITGSLLPFEVYELVEKLSLPRVGMISVNLAILFYLIYRLRRDKQKHLSASIDP